MLGKTNASGSALAIGDVTQSDKSGNVNFLRCQGQTLTSGAVFDSLKNIVDSRDSLALNWTYAYGFSANSDSKMIFGDGVFVISRGGAVYSSVDGATWTLRSNPSQFSAMLYANGIYLGVTANGSVYTSTDTITWTLRKTGACTYDGHSAVYSCCYGNGTFVIGGYGGTIETSSDAITWTARGSVGITQNITSISYGDKFVCGGTRGQIYRSVNNGVSWVYTSAGFDNSNGDAVVTLYADGKYIAAGIINGTNTLRWSTDGVTWSSANSVNMPGATNVVYYASGVYLAGNSGLFAIYVSTDLLKWTTAYSATGATGATGAFCFGNDKFLASNIYATTIRESPNLVKLPFYHTPAYVKVS